MVNNEHEIIKEVMNHKDLVDELEKVNPGIKTQMVGYLFNPWLPHGATRKIIMAVIVIIALIGGFFYGKRLFYLVLLILPIFSPRILGEVVRFFGIISKN